MGLEKTGQMNSTCRGEGEGLNCKTRQKECVLQSLRRSHVLWRLSVCHKHAGLRVFLHVVPSETGQPEKSSTENRYGNTEKTRKHAEKKQTKKQLSVGSVSTCVIAQTLSLLSSPVQPDTEAHENDPASPSDARNEGRLLHNVRDLLRDAVVPVSAYDHVTEVFT